MQCRVLVALLALHTAALYLFTTGFFLTRFEVSDLSRCQAPPSETVDNLRGGPEDPASLDNESCWMPRRFRRVVFVVIDALRYDFAATGLNTRRSAFYSDRLSIFNDTLTREPGHALLLKFVADPPTMTMQRLKGLTTGSLPTFLDIKDNMAASSQIVEDNLLRQLRTQHRGVVFMGDDTWNSLYAREFTREFAFDSFNVKDLHSVDRGVTAHLFPELMKSDWDLLIAHFLGIDHVGHTHGPVSVFMAQKLDEMNIMLQKLLQTLKDMPDGEDVLLAVLGDHGMSADGNHGGASDEETGAALFLYSKASLVVTGRVEDSKEAKELKHFAEKLLDSSREVPQVDLVPTLALLIGLPIPFGNLGSVIPPLFFVPPPSLGNRENSTLAAFQMLNRALTLNLYQVRRYLLRYSSATKLPERAYDQLEKEYEDIKRIKQQLQQVQKGSSYSKADLPLLLRLHQDIARRQQNYLREALSLGRSIWTQFDLCNMGWGMLLLAWTFLIGASNTRVFTLRSVISNSWSPPLGIVAATSGLLIICPTKINLPFLPAAPTSRGLVAGACTVLIDMSLHSFFENSLARIQGKVTSVRTSPSAAGVVATFVVVLHAFALFSNSYIVAESNVMQFLSATIGIFLFICAQQRNCRTATGAALAFMLATRMSSALEPPNIIKATATWEHTFAPLIGVAAVAVGSSLQMLLYLRDFLGCVANQSDFLATMAAALRVPNIFRNSCLLIRKHRTNEVSNQQSSYKVEN
ncbi:putative Type I phosphodiesterase/nucleotide pyrophosphatase/phosphate transferase [Plasmopara halstedii]